MNPSWFHGTSRSFFYNLAICTQKFQSLFGKPIPKSQPTKRWDNNMPRSITRRQTTARPSECKVPHITLHRPLVGRACPETSRSNHLEDAFLEAAATRNLENGPTPPHCPAARSRVRPSTLAYGSSSESSGGAGLSRALDI